MSERVASGICARLPRRRTRVLAFGGSAEVVASDRTSPEEEERSLVRIRPGRGVRPVRTREVHLIRRLTSVAHHDEAPRLPVSSRRADPATAIAPSISSSATDSLE